MKLALTHEEIGQMIGSSRETVSRLFAGFKKQHHPADRLDAV
jgi:CRP-like cAMP-binding protein